MIYELEEKSSDNESTTSSEEWDGLDLRDCIKCQKIINVDKIKLQNYPKL